MAESAPALFFEDAVVGRRYQTGSVDVTEDEIKTFAARYDPQPMHVDPEAAKESVFGGLVSSGWMTASLTMRLMVMGEFHLGAGIVGLGVDTLHWPRPVRPGDRLSATIEVIAVRASASKPAFGLAKIRTLTTNQNGETVQMMVSNVLLPRRPR